MTTVTLTLTDFLLARIAEDEAAARNYSASPYSLGVWEVELGREGLAHDRVLDRVNPDGGAWIGVADQVYGEAAAHIARHDPARVLADVEAKRRIVELHTAPPWIMRAFTSPVDGSSHPERVFESDTCPMCAEAVGYLGDEHEPYPCDTLKALASVYADHPEFRQEWKP